MQEPADGTDNQSLVSIRTMDIAVALLFLIVSGIVIADSLRVGIEWRPAQGPAPGYFPFYISLAMAAASVFNLVRALRVGHNARASFVSREGFQRVAIVVIPFFFFVLGVNYIGLYISAAILITGFMVLIGGESLLKAIPVAIGVPFVFFLLFEKWFIVPLPKGPIEQMFGF